MPRPQFSLKTLLWLMAVVAAFYPVDALLASPVDALLASRGPAA